MSATLSAANRPANLPARLFGFAMILAGIGGWFYNHHLATTEGEFYIRLCVFSPLAVFGGLLFLVRPEWTGPLRKDSPNGHKISLCVVIGLMALFSGLDMYSLMSGGQQQKFQPPSRANWSPNLGTPSR
jgi:hypothetical protein